MEGTTARGKEATDTIFSARFVNRSLLQAMRALMMRSHGLNAVCFAFITTPPRQAHCCGCILTTTLITLDFSLPGGWFLYSRRMLLYRERHGISTSIHVALTSVLERTTARDDVVSALSEISGTVEHCLDKFLSELNTTSTQLAAPSQPSLHTSLVRYTRLGLRLPDTVVQHILTAAINRYAIPSERRRRVLQVSATNQQWRAVAKQHLWTRLDDLEPRELTNLPRLLEFAAPQVLLTVELDMQFGDAIQIHNALAGHMNRMRLLKLSNATVGPALLTPAHRLETLTLVFSEHSTLPIHLFGHVAPRLASVELLGRFPKLLGGYEVFRGVKWLKANIGDRRDDTPIHIRHLRRAFPHLETLILNETFGLQPTHTMASDPHWSLRRLEVHEQNNLAQMQGLVCQLPLLGHEWLEHMHIIHGTPNTLSLLKHCGHCNAHVSAKLSRG